MPTRQLHRDRNPTYCAWSDDRWRVQVDELSCEPDLLSGAKLDAGDEAVCTGNYLVTHGDIDAGEVTRELTFGL